MRRIWLQPRRSFSITLFLIWCLQEAAAPRDYAEVDKNCVFVWKKQCLALFLTFFSVWERKMKKENLCLCKNHLSASWDSNIISLNWCSFVIYLLSLYPLPVVQLFPIWTTNVSHRLCLSILLNSLSHPPTQNIY